MNIFVNDNYIGTIVGISNNGGANFLMSGTFSNPGSYLITINTSTDPDPIIDYDLGVSNFGDSFSRFTFSMSFNTVGGPYGSTDQEYVLGLEDLGGDGASALPGGGTVSTFTARSFAPMDFGSPWFVSSTLGDVPIGDLGTPCVAAPGSSTTCSENANVFHGLTQGTLYSTVSFQLGPTDRATFQSVTSVGEVPEPAAAWLIGAGLLGVAGLRSRRRKSA
jgi:hypothetical protein